MNERETGEESRRKQIINKNGFLDSSWGLFKISDSYLRQNKTTQSSLKAQTTAVCWCFGVFIVIGYWWWTARQKDEEEPTKWPVMFLLVSWDTGCVFASVSPVSVGVFTHDLHFIDNLINHTHTLCCQVTHSPALLSVTHTHQMYHWWRLIRSVQLRHSDPTVTSLLWLTSLSLWLITSFLPGD